MGNLPWGLTKLKLRLFHGCINLFRPYRRLRLQAITDHVRRSSTAAIWGPIGIIQVDDGFGCRRQVRKKAGFNL